MRGKQNYYELLSDSIGITPAGAGKTMFFKQFHINGRDHPRRCGENKRFYALIDFRIGSPPQVRGKHKALAKQDRATGITPAGAGKTLC